MGMATQAPHYEKVIYIHVNSTMQYMVIPHIFKYVMAYHLYYECHVHIES